MRRALSHGPHNDVVAALLIVTGPPGSGKSSVAPLIVEGFERSVLVEGDAFFGFVARGSITPWLPEANQQNEVITRAAAAAAGRYADGGFVTVYDGIVGPWFLPTFLTASGLRGLDYVVLLPAVERCLERMRTRRGHGFKDEQAALHMYRAFADADIDGRHVLHDPPDDPDEAAGVVVSAFRSGRLAYPAERRPAPS